MAQTLPLLVFAILNSLSCHSEVRARDPDVEEEEAMGERAQHMPGAFGIVRGPIPHDHPHHGTPVPVASVGMAQNLMNPLRERSSHRGNWCAHVNHRVVTTAVLCTETQTVKSVNPCPDGAPDCQIIMYKLSTRPMYKQKQTTLSSLHWQCCTGYRGQNCLEKDKHPEDEDRVSKSKTESRHSEASTVNSNKDSEGKIQTDQLEDTDWEDGPQQEHTIHEASLPVHPHQIPDDTREGIPTSQPLPILDSSILLSMHQLMSIMMSQLQPVLESFNQTLQRLSGDVEVLSRDMQQLQMKEFGDESRRTEAHRGHIEEKLEYSHLQIGEIKTQLETQKDQMERAFQIQQEVLHHNLTKLKEEMDDQISQSLDTQVNLQSLNALVDELRHGQKRLERTLQREGAESVKPAQESRVWGAITRLDEKAKKNSEQLSSLSRTSEDTASALQTLQENLLNLGQKVKEVKKDSEVHFAETGLELEAVRVRVQQHIGDLTTNISAHEGQLREIELDLNNIYHELQKTDSPIARHGCTCQSIADSLMRLEMQVVNVTHLAKKNRVDTELDRHQARWTTEVEDLHQGLLNMKESLAFEQGKSRIINNDISQLKVSLLDSQLEIRSLKEKDEAKLDEIRGLSATFSSLLSDAVRHSEVLEVLLGEEVLEFTTWSHNHQKELSIPNLLQKIHEIQQKIDNHDRSLASLRKKLPKEAEMHSDDPLAYSEWTGTKTPLGYHTPGPSTGDEEDEDYSVSDFWSLGKEVEELAGRINLLEERCGNCTATLGGPVVELQPDLTAIRQNLEDHLKRFEKLFSHTEELTSSGRTLNLDEVWKLVRRAKKKNRKENHNQENTQRENKNSSSRRDSETDN